MAAGSRIEIPAGADNRQVLGGTGESRAIKNIETLNHPWKQNQPLPTSYSEAGLGEDAVLVFKSVYLDGGSRVFAFKDGAGRYLVFCTTKPKMQAEYDKDQSFEERFYLRAVHWKDKGGMVVPRGSKTEDFLLKSISGRIVEDTP